MQRPIKFRAWQPHSSYHRKPGMYEVVDIIWYEDGKPPETGEVFFKGQKSSEYLGDIKLMQYTGLKDKNGTEIYEGDIVLAANEDEQKRKRLYVHYQDKQAEWQFGDKDDWGVTNMHYINKVTIEVIGNIYEHGDLLK